MIKEFIKYYKPYKKLFMLDMLAAFTVALCDLVYPLITRSIMNDVVPNKDLRMLIVCYNIISYIYNKGRTKLLYAILGSCCWCKDAR